MKKCTLIGMAALMLYPQALICGAELTGNANVDSATKIDAMNKSANESWNMNDQKGIRLLVLFDKGSTQIARKYTGVLRNFANYMTNHPKTRADIFGHSDQMSGKPVDIELAQARANVVRQYLMKEYAIDGNRLKAVGYGQVTARATNVTKSEKQLNRRVFAIIREAPPAS